MQGIANGYLPQLDSALLHELVSASTNTCASRKSLAMDEVLSLMKKGAGTDFNPLLADNFSKNFEAAIQKGG